jgi:hypothetical protein
VCVARLEEYFDSRVLDSLAEASSRAAFSENESAPPGQEPACRATGTPKGRPHVVPVIVGFADGSGTIRVDAHDLPDRRGQNRFHHRNIEKNPWISLVVGRRGLDRSLRTVRRPVGRRGGRNGSTVQGRPRPVCVVRSPGAPGDEPLSAREREVPARGARGTSSLEIARERSPRGSVTATRRMVPVRDVSTREGLLGTERSHEKPTWAGRRLVPGQAVAGPVHSPDVGEGGEVSDG